MRIFLFTFILSISTNILTAADPTLNLCANGEVRQTTTGIALLPTEIATAASNEVLLPLTETFWCFKVAGNGDCGFYALESTRSEIIQALQKDLDDPLTLALLHYEARNYYADKDFNYYEKISNEFTRQDAEKFLKDRYIKAKGRRGEKYYLDVIPHSEGTGLINWIARHKKVNLNIWQWNKGQDPTKGIKLIKVITVEDAERTIDIVLGMGHFSRLVNINQDLLGFDENVKQAIAQETYWHKVSGR